MSMREAQFPRILLIGSPVSEKNSSRKLADQAHRQWTLVYVTYSVTDGFRVAFQETLVNFPNLVFSVCLNLFWSHTPVAIVVTLVVGNSLFHVGWQQLCEGLHLHKHPKVSIREAVKSIVKATAVGTTVGLHRTKLLGSKGHRFPYSASGI
jgi:hypothetical protein